MKKFLMGFLISIMLLTPLFSGLNKHGYKIRCNACQYVWHPRLKTPVECPRCKQRLD